MAGTQVTTVFERMGDRELLLYLARKLDMAIIDLTAVNAALAQLTTDVNSLITADVGAAGAAAAQLVADQAALAPVPAAISALDAQVQAALAPAVVVGPTGTTGATGTAG